MLDDRNIVIIGYRCAGKTSVGRDLARELGRRFLDLDEWIETRAGRSIETIVSGNGWACFRNLEREAVRSISKKTRMVVATGGGVVMDEENVKCLKERGILVWLRAEEGELRKRMAGDLRKGMKRPSITGHDPLGEIGRELERRAPYYEGASDMVVDTGSMSTQEVAAVIIQGLRELKENEGTRKWQETRLVRFSG